MFQHLDFRQAKNKTTGPGDQPALGVPAFQGTRADTDAGVPSKEGLLTRSGFPQL